MKIMSRAILASLAVIAGTPAMAEVSLKGFGTVGVSNANTDDADYVANNFFQPNGTGRTRGSSFAVDSKFGAQVDWKLNPTLSFTGQVLSKQDDENSMMPQLEWAFAKVSVTPELDVRVGRIRPAIYMLSDFLDVNYANPWVRPPVEFYTSAPISRIEGMDVLWRPTIGDVSLLVQPYLGTTKLKLPGTTELEYKKIRGVNVSANLGEFTYRAGYIGGKINVISRQFSTQLLPALDAICSMLPLPLRDPVACEQRIALDATDKAASFASLGASYDNGDYFINAEYGKRKTDSFIGDGTTWYLNGGMRIGKWTPHLTYSSYRIDSANLFTRGKFPGTAALLQAGIITPAHIAAGFPLLPSTNQLATAALQNDIMDSDTITLGARYDLSSTIAIKGQWDRVSTHANGPGTGKGLFINTANGFADRSNHVDVISLSVDFVF